jgi:hypothetical protein
LAARQIPLHHSMPGMPLVPLLSATTDRVGILSDDINGARAPARHRYQAEHVINFSLMEVPRHGVVLLFLLLDKSDAPRVWVLRPGETHKGGANASGGRPRELTDMLGPHHLGNHIASGTHACVSGVSPARCLAERFVRVHDAVGPRTRARENVFIRDELPVEYPVAPFNHCVPAGGRPRLSHQDVMPLLPPRHRTTALANFPNSLQRFPK